MAVTYRRFACHGTEVGQSAAIEGGQIRTVGPHGGMSRRSVGDSVRTPKCAQNQSHKLCQQVLQTMEMSRKRCSWAVVTHSPLPVATGPSRTMAWRRKQLRNTLGVV